MKNLTKYFLSAVACLLAFASITAQDANIVTGNYADIKLENCVGINTEHLEFSPTFYQNGIIFTSARLANGPRDEKIGETFFELFFAEFDGSGMPFQAEDFSVLMNTRVHEGPVTFSRTGDMIYFTRNNLKNNATKADNEGLIRMQVYEAKKGYFEWEKSTPLPFNSNEYDVMHPTLSPDGKTMYFTSNMPGSIGGTDIWMVSKSDDLWGTPVNMGPEINTAKNEAFSFIHESGTLFFASQGLPGKGGYDLYKASVSGSSVSGVVENLGEPFNTPQDDFGLILNAEGNRGYFTSARETGSGKDDIYKFDGFIASPSALAGMLKVYDAKTGAPIEGAGIRIFERTSDGLVAGGELYDAILMPSAPGSNDLVLKLVRKGEGDLGDPDLFTNVEGISPYDMQAGKQYIFLVSKDGYQSNELVYSTVGKTGDILVEVPLDKYTCINLTGEVKTPGGTPISNATVKMVSSCGSKDITTDGSGKFNECLEPGCSYDFIGSKSGYNSGTSSLTVPLDGGGAMSTTIVLSPIAGPATSGGTLINTGTVIVLEKIYYDFDKSYIRTGAARELDELITIMKAYPSMTVELASHTDSRGATSYNQNLSERRAESAKRYLVARGISPSRVTTVGRGESTLRNQCANGVKCSEEEHQYNRRTEVRVTSIREAVRVEYGNRGPEIIDRMR